MEKWLDIDGYEGLYQVSDKGNVRSIDRYVISKGGASKLVKGVVLKQQVDKDGYKRVGLHKDGVQKIVGVHRLVAEAFLLKEEGKYIVDHIDGNPSNNAKENLRWVTTIENNGTSIAKKRKSISAIKREDNKRKIRQYYLNGGIVKVYDSSMDIEREFGFEHSAILRCCQGKQKTSYGYKWVYLD